MNRLDSPLGSALRRVDWLSAAAVGLLALTGLLMAWLNARSYGQELLTPSSLLVRSSTWTVLAVVVSGVLIAGTGVVAATTVGSTLRPPVRGASTVTYAAPRSSRKASARARSACSASA